MGKFAGETDRARVFYCRGSQYYVTQQTYQLVEKIRTSLSEALEAIEQFPQLPQLLIFLEHILDASLQSPHHKWLRYGRNGRGNLTNLALLNHYAGEFGAFRTDVHLASWRIYEIDAVAWDAFTWIWRGEVDTASALHEKLPFLGLSVEKFEQGLQEAVGRGWLSITDGKYHITEEGRKIRDEVERLTDERFFAPWQTLNPEELEELQGLLIGLRDHLSRQMTSQA